MVQIAIAEREVTVECAESARSAAGAAFAGYDLRAGALDTQDEAREDLEGA